MQSELIHVDLLNKILYQYEHAVGLGLEEIEEKDLIQKANNKKVFYVVEGMSTDPTTTEYINGEKESLVDHEFIKKKTRKIEVDLSESSSSEEEIDDPNVMIDF